MSVLLKLTDDEYLIECPYYDVGLGLGFVIGEKKAVIIDSGVASSPAEAVFPYLKRIGFNPRDISMIVNTHGHEDHMGGNWAIKERSKAKIHAHKFDVSWIEDRDILFREVFARFPQYVPVTKEYRSIFYSERGKACLIDVHLIEGDAVEVDGKELRVIYTPGHSPGSICLYDKPNRVLFSGDAIQGRGVHSPEAPCIPIYADPNVYLKSVREIMKLNVDLLLTAHPFKPFEKMVLRGGEVKRLCLESLDIVEQIRARVVQIIERSEELLTLLQITKEISMEFANAGISIQALNSVDGHLRKLRDEGKLEYYKKGEDLVAAYMQ